MKLYGVPLSPFVRKAMMTLEHFGIAYDNVPTFPGDTSPEFLAISPLRKIPVLVDGDFVIADTSVICRYLDRIADGQSLYPADPQDEARACFLEEFADSKLIECCAGIFRERLLKPKMMQQPTDEDTVAAIINEQLPELLSYLEGVTPESGYLVGDHLSIADLSVMTCFLQAQYGDYAVDGASYPRLRAYLDRAFAAPLVANRMTSERANLPPGL